MIISLKNDKLLVAYQEYTGGEQYDSVEIPEPGYWDLVGAMFALEWNTKPEYLNIQLDYGIFGDYGGANYYITTLPDYDTTIFLGPGFPWHESTRPGCTLPLMPIRLTQGDAIGFTIDSDTGEHWLTRAHMIFRKYDPPPTPTGDGGGGIERSLYRDASGYVVP